jgi:hypothetical protein
VERSKVAEVIEMVMQAEMWRHVVEVHEVRKRAWVEESGRGSKLRGSSGLTR